MRTAFSMLTSVTSNSGTLIGSAASTSMEPLPSDEVCRSKLTPVVARTSSTLFRTKCFNSTGGVCDGELIQAIIEREKKTSEAPCFMSTPLVFVGRNSQALEFMLTGVLSRKAPISIAVVSQLRRNNPHGEDACPMHSQVRLRHLRRLWHEALRDGFRTNQGAMRPFNAPVAEPTRRSPCRVACGS